MTTRFKACLLALVAGAFHPGPSTAQQPAPEAATAPAPDWARDEERVRAREDVANLDAYVKAKAARLREAELRFAMLKERQVSVVRQKDKGLISALAHNQGGVWVAEAEAERETRAAELKEVESRRDRAKRRLALIERGLDPGPPPSGPLLSDHRELDRIRSELDDVKRRLRMLSPDP